VWGAEDDDFLVRASRAGFRAAQLPSPALIHSYHTSDTCDLAKKQSDQYQKNYSRFKQTVAGKLPQIRMPYDWGLHSSPRPGKK
jgi:GT2 family glycosyltransferase